MHAVRILQDYDTRLEQVVYGTRSSMPVTIPPDLCGLVYSKTFFDELGRLSDKSVSSLLYRYRASSGVHCIIEYMCEDVAARRRGPSHPTSSPSSSAQKATAMANTYFRGYLRLLGATSFATAFEKEHGRHATLELCKDLIQKTEREIDPRKRNVCTEPSFSSEEYVCVPGWNVQQNTMFENTGTGPFCASDTASLDTENHKEQCGKDGVESMCRHPSPFYVCIANESEKQNIRARFLHDYKAMKKYRMDQKNDIQQEYSALKKATATAERLLMLPLCLQPVTLSKTQMFLASTGPTGTGDCCFVKHHTYMQMAHVVHPSALPDICDPTNIHPTLTGLGAGLHDLTHAQVTPLDEHLVQGLWKGTFLVKSSQTCICVCQNTLQVIANRCRHLHRVTERSDNGSADLDGGTCASGLLQLYLVLIDRLQLTVFSHYLQRHRLLLEKPFRILCLCMGQSHDSESRASLEAIVKHIRHTLDDVRVYNDADAEAKAAREKGLVNDCEIDRDDMVNQMYADQTPARLSGGRVVINTWLSRANQLHVECIHDPSFNAHLIAYLWTRGVYQRLDRMMHGSPSLSVNNTFGVSDCIAQYINDLCMFHVYTSTMLRQMSQVVKNISPFGVVNNNAADYVSSYKAALPYLTSTGHVYQGKWIAMACKMDSLPFLRRWLFNASTRVVMTKRVRTLCLLESTKTASEQGLCNKGEEGSALKKIEQYFLEKMSTYSKFRHLRLHYEACVNEIRNIMACVETTKHLKKGGDIRASDEHATVALHVRRVQKRSRR